MLWNELGTPNIYVEALIPKVIPFEDKAFEGVRMKP